MSTGREDDINLEFPARRSRTLSRMEIGAGADMPTDADMPRADAAETPIKVQIMGSEYRVGCPPDERDALMAAAQHLDDTMQGIRGTGKVMGVERIAVMAALNISYELLNTQRNAGRMERAFDERVRQLLDRTDGLLKGIGQGQAPESGAPAGGGGDGEATPRPGRGDHDLL